MGKTGKKKPLAFILLIVTGLFLGGCSGCEKRDDETQIRQLIENGALLAEQHKLKELMRLTTDDFLAMPNTMDRRSVKGMLFMAFRRYGKFKIRLPRPTVNVDASLAYAEATTPFAIIREDRTVPDLTGLYEDPESWLNALGEMAELYNLGLWLVKKEDRWLIRKARLKPYHQ